MINNKEYLNIKNKQYLPTNKGVWAAKAALTAQIEKQQEIEASPQENKALPKKKPYMVSQANIPEELNSEANNFPNESENNLSEIKVIVTPPEDSYLDRIFSPSKIDDGGELRDSQYEKLFTSALQNNPAPSEEK